MEPESHQVNILLVDDSESNLIALETILQAGDRNVVRAASGDQALQYLLYNDAAVVLLDVRMPGIDGLQTAELIRGRKQSRDVPIIFLTAYDSVDNQETSRGYSLGAVDYLVKPIDPDALRAKVAVFVELYKTTQQVRRQAALLHEKNLQLENANFQRLGKLVELGKQLAVEREPEQLLRVFCDAARDIVGAQYAAVSIVEPDGRSVRHLVESGLELVGAAVSRGPLAEGEVPGGGSSNNQSLRVRNLDHARYIRELLLDAAAPNSLLVTPIFLPDTIVGSLYLMDKVDAESFSEADERLAMTLTSQVAVAYENARLYAEAQRIASELLLEVSERKQAQEEKERVLLSEKAARLEAEMARGQVSELLVREKQARAEAETASRLKDDFLATVSHELRTPLSAMLGWAVLLRDKRLDEPSVPRAIDTIERNARTLSRIVGDILDASRIITGKLGLDLRPVELVPVIESAADMLGPAAEVKTVSVEVSLHRGGGLIVLGDSDRLQQIVWNLLSNAIKFTPAGGRVQLILESAGDHAELKVTDTGQGISPEFLPYVFDRFRQADSSMTRVQGGLGLGLAIVQHLVELHGGTVSADSPGRGSGATFSVRIPLATAASGAGDPWKRPAQKMGRAGESSHEPVDLSGLRILVVDDEPDTRDLVGVMMKQYGAEVRGSASASEALAILENWRPHLLLSDIGMPEQDGNLFIRQVRALTPQKGGDIPAVAVTAYARDQDRERSLAAGYQSHLAKPVDQAQLVALVANLTGRSRRKDPRT